MSLRTAFVAALLLLSLDGPRFAPAEGSSVRKRYTERTSLSLDSAEMRLGNQVIRPPALEFDVKVARELAVVDTYAALGKERPARLSRVFERIAGALEVSSQEEGRGREVAQAAYRSPLTGLEVVFTWDEEQETYGVAFGQKVEDGDAELLEGLLEDADLRALLPEGDAKEGDEWALDPAALGALLSPCGDLRWVPVPGNAPDPGALVIGHFYGVGEIGAGLAGEAKARLLSLASGEAVIRVDLEVTAERNAYGRMVELAGELAGDGEDSVSFDEFRVTTTVDGTATLIWDLARGRARSLELKADVDAVLKAKTRGLNMQMVFELSGETTLALGTSDA
jgi:hypothetical protein